jgi:hypothetical protein
MEATLDDEVVETAPDVFVWVCHCGRVGDPLPDFDVALMALSDHRRHAHEATDG